MSTWHRSLPVHPDDMLPQSYFASWPDEDDEPAEAPAIFLHHNPRSGLYVAELFLPSLQGPLLTYRTLDVHTTEESALDELAAWLERGDVQDEFPEPEPWWASRERDAAAAQRADVDQDVDDSPIPDVVFGEVFVAAEECAV
jgi:hypothetical protein